LRIAALAFALVVAACTSAPESSPQRIEESSWLSIGGIEQWVTIRGDDNRKPVLLLVHGGPGDAQSGFVQAYAPYEKDFVLVQWDQRGGGKTFEKYVRDTPDLTLDRQVSDGIELAEHLCKRFPKQKLVVFGHSWGTILSTGMVQKRPDLFDAYVGAGQVASWAAIVNYQFDFLLDAARKTSDAATVTQLEAIGRPNPTDVAQYFTIARTMRANMPPDDRAWFASIRTTPGVSEADIANAGAGMNFSGQTLIQTLMQVDLTKSAPSFPISWCVVHGRLDLNAPLPPVEAYAATMKAPKKHMATIDDAGHFALATRQSAFIAELKTCLAP
jgi:proline iminopeptidase